jgi:hypothetical protein
MSVTIGDVRVAAHRFACGTADVKPHSVSCGPGCEERIERLFKVAIEDTRSIIEDTDTDRLTVDYLSCMIGHGTTSSRIASTALPATAAVPPDDPALGKRSSFRISHLLREIAAGSFMPACNVALSRPLHDACRCPATVRKPTSVCENVGALTQPSHK